MRVLAQLSTFALAPLVGGGFRAAGVAVADEGMSVVARFLTDRLTDQSLRVVDALRGSAGRAWRALEVALYKMDSRIPEPTGTLTGSSR